IRERKSDEYRSPAWIFRNDCERRVVRVAAGSDCSHNRRQRGGGGEADPHRVESHHRMVRADVHRQRDVAAVKSELRGAAAKIAKSGLAPTRLTLDNGVVLLTKQTTTTPAVAINLAVRAGSIVDPPDAPGTTWLLSRVIDRGTRGRPASDIA